MESGKRGSVWRVGTAVGGVCREGVNVVGLMCREINNFRKNVLE